MALQDIPIAHLPQVPYPFGSPEYQAAILPFLEKQLQAQAREASNARGGFYSGPAMADEQQAASNLAYQMAQQGAQQSEAEKQMMEQQQFQSSENQANRQAEADAARAAGKSAMLGQAIGGLTSPLGMIGGLYGYDKLKGYLGGGGGGHPGAGAGVGAGANPELFSGAGAGANPELFPGAGAGTSSELSPGAGSAMPEAPGNYLAQEYGAAPGGSSVADAANGVNAGQGAAGAAGFNLGGFGMPSGGQLALALPAAMEGSTIGRRTFGGGRNSDIASGIGGAAGAVLGAPFLGPFGSAAGAAAGSYLGRSYAQHPGLAALGPFGMPIAAIPQAPHFLQQNLVNPIEKAATGGFNAVKDFFGGLF